VAVTIDPEPADSAESRRLIAELEAELDGAYPPESQHGYSVEKLISEGVHFFLVRSDAEAAGCGGVQLFGSEYGELKRMFIRPPFRGRGLGRLLIDRLAEHAREYGVPLLRLETGIKQLEAIRLYEGMGFYQVPPFGPYRLDRNSVFYELPV
jgi:GNAT superfamily N-acetyltransferase